MISDEWWIYHLTKDGWIEGSYKHDFENPVEKSHPSGTLLTRRYYEKLGHQYAQMKRGFEDQGAISQEVKELLKTYPHPKGFDRFG